MIWLSIILRDQCFERRKNSMTPKIAREFVRFNKHIEDTKTMYGQVELCLKVAKSKLALGQAKFDHLYAKLAPEWNFTNKYTSKRNCCYLSPIPEESEDDLQEYDSDIFPSESNTNLAATTARNGQLFLDSFQIKTCIRNFHIDKSIKL